MELPQKQEGQHGSDQFLEVGARGCDLDRVDPVEFMGSMRGKTIGLVGDSSSENLVVAFVCVLRGADNGAKKWKKVGAWRGAYFPKFDATVPYHRAVLLAKYR